MRPHAAGIGGRGRFAGSYRRQPTPELNPRPRRGCFDGAWRRQSAPTAVFGRLGVCLTPSPAPPSPASGHSSSPAPPRRAPISNCAAHAAPRSRIAPPVPPPDLELRARAAPRSRIWPPHPSPPLRRPMPQTHPQTTPPPARNQNLAPQPEIACPLLWSERPQKPTFSTTYTRVRHACARGHTARARGYQLCSTAAPALPARSAGLSGPLQPRGPAHDLPV